MPASWKKSYDKPRQHVKKQRCHSANKGLYSQRYGFPVVMYRCECRAIKKVWVPKNLYFQTAVLERILESPLDSKEIKTVNLKGKHPWILIGMTDAEAEAPILWPLDMSSQLIGKDPDAGKDWRQKEKRVTEDETFGWHHWFSGHELGQT